MLNETVAALHIPPERVDAEVKAGTVELERRERAYRAGLPPLDLRGRTVILVDDGLATGATMEAAVAVIWQHRPARLVLAVPVAPLDTLERFRFAVDELVYVETPEPFRNVGYWYVDFSPIEDEEVLSVLDQMRSRVPAGRG